MGWPDIHRTRWIRYVSGITLNNIQNHLPQHSSINLWQRQQFTALLQAGDVFVHPENMDAAIAMTKGFQAFKTGTGIMQHMGTGVQADTVYRHQCRLTPLIITIFR